MFSIDECHWPISLNAATRHIFASSGFLTSLSGLHSLDDQSHREQQCS